MPDVVVLIPTALIEQYEDPKFYAHFAYFAQVFIQDKAKQRVIVEIDPRVDAVTIGGQIDYKIVHGALCTFFSR